jgi:RHS repeat-associated protein
MSTTSQLSENSHRGFDGIKAALCLGSTEVKFNTASGMQLRLRRNGIRSRSSGKERDAETGLDYFGARYYSGAQGRFSSPDPLLNSGRPDNPQSWNRYIYVSNNPLKYIDPTGLFEWDATLGGSLNDDELRRSAGKNRNLRRQANSIIDQRNAIRHELKRLAKSHDVALQEAAIAINAENVDNGVKISMGSVKPGTSAQEMHSNPLTIDSQGNPELEIRVQPGASGASLFMDLAHEGTHAADAQTFAYASTPMTIFGFESELHAYKATIGAGRKLGWSNVGPGVGTPRFWDSSWSKVDQQTRPTHEIMRFLFSSPAYSRNDLLSPAFTK